MHRRHVLIRSVLVLALLAPALSSVAAGQSRGRFTPSGTMERAAVPSQYKWDLRPMFVDDAAFDAALQQAAEGRERIASFAGKLAAPSRLADCLEAYFSTRLLTNKATLYAAMRFDSDQTSTALQAMRDRAQDALHQLMQASAFIRQEVLALDDAAFVAALKKSPTLRGHRPYLDEMRRRRTRVLPPEAERVLAMAGDNLWAEIDLNEIPSDFEKAFGALLTDLPLPKIQDEKGEQVQLTLSSYPKYRGSSSRKVRRDAVESFFATLERYQHAFAATFSGQVRLNVLYARAHGYPTALAAYLDKDNIDTAVYTNLIETVHANLAPLHEYVRLRKEVMGLDEVRIYDLYPPLVPSVEMQFPFEEARRILPEALAPLGPAYVQVLRQALDPSNGWIDVYPNKHKDSGAFSSSVYGVHPYVKMNYYEELDDLSTLAHEYGHALHSFLAMGAQPYVTFNYVPFIAEIASTMNEKLLSDYLVQHAESDSERLYILNQLLESIRTTIYRQALFAEFELAAHTAAEKGEPLTAELLTGIYRNLLVRYYGPDFTIGDHDAVEWAYIPHFYYKYYMYTYATGLSSGIALAERVQSGDAVKRDAYLAMLAGGSSKPPLELLEDAGVDLTRPEAVQAATRLMGRTIEQMRALLSKTARK